MHIDSDSEVGRVRRLGVAGTQLEIETLDRLDSVVECPHFGVLWPSAIALSEHLRSRADSQPIPSNVLELGCGLAIPSMIASRLGARRVVATDRHPAVSRLLRRNAACNGLSRIEYRNLDWRKIGDRADRYQCPLGFDFVMGSDLLYEPWQPGALANLLANLLERGAEALIADPGRRYVDEFVRLMEAAQFRCDLEAVRTVQHGGAAVDVLLVAVRA